MLLRAGAEPSVVRDPARMTDSSGYRLRATRADARLGDIRASAGRDVFGEGWRAVRAVSGATSAARRQRPPSAELFDVAARGGGRASTRGDPPAPRWSGRGAKSPNLPSRAVSDRTARPRRMVSNRGSHRMPIPPSPRAQRRRMCVRHGFRPRTTRHRCRPVRVRPIESTDPDPGDAPTPITADDPRPPTVPAPESPLSTHPESVPADEIHPPLPAGPVSSFTDRWSSWIHSDLPARSTTARRPMPHLASVPTPHSTPQFRDTASAWSEPVTEPTPLRRRVTSRPPNRRRERRVRPGSRPSEDECPPL